MAEEENLDHLLIFIPRGSEDELWFALGKTKVRFGKREFCLCTGLKFGCLSDIPSREYEVVPDGIHARVLFGQNDQNQVAYWMFSLVEDVQAFNNFT
ncbi:hypothetical protein Q3G72_006097 [Acer saccharum]|nr:hypothetical protein Q3G72_006097 [Acer saccharum]